MTTVCNNHYEQLHKASAAVLVASFADSQAATMAKSHAFIDDFAQWLEELSNRPEVPVFQAALREYQFALLALSIGHYRAAFVSLRLTLELCLAAIQWSANERELREWLKGQRDSNWATIIDNENGIFSKQFIRLFFEGLADEASGYRASAVAVYRECSEYVHGNAHTHQTLPEQIVFDSTSFDAWQQKASAVRLIITFALAARYIFDFDQNSRSRLEPMLMDYLGHSVGIRALLGVTIEG
jgi:hypothetical protein